MGSSCLGYVFKPLYGRDIYLKFAAMRLYFVDTIMSQAFFLTARYDFNLFLFIMLFKFCFPKRRFKCKIVIVFMLRRNR